MRSRSTFGLSLITLVFRDGVDDYWARTRIRERVAGATLPDGANPDLDPLTVRFTDLHRYVTELPDFGGDPKASNEGKLEAIQMAWHEEYQDRTQA